MSNTKLKTNYITVFIIVMAITMALLTSGCFGDDTASTPPTTTPVTTTHIETGDSAISAQIVSITFDKDNYKAGDKVTAILTIKNIGTDEITSEKIDITARLVKLKSTAANLALKALSDEKKTRTYSMPYKNSIQPGETKKLSAVFTTQKELEGISLAGEYDVYVKLSVNDVNVGSSSLVLKLD
ncbi:MAG: hypothetical protein KAH86_07300 [Methanosarcinales archaeon]|nr:hypothetical protein [Methanosarcinales archaeon]